MLRIWLINSFLFLCLSLFANHISAQQAIVDLRGVDLSVTEVKLMGEWQLYWNQLLTPDQVLSAEQPLMVPFPKRWNELGDVFRGITALGYGTYRLLVYLPPGSSGLGLDLPDVYTSYKLYVNGELLSSNGAPGTNKQNTQPQWLGKTIQLPPQTDTLELVLQIANFHHAKGGPYKDLVIGNFEKLYNQRKRDGALDLLMSGALLMGGLFFIGLYLFGKYDRAMLFFALYCIVYSYRPVGSRLYVLHDMFSQFNWQVAVRLEYFTLFASIGFFAFYTHFLYPKESNKKIILSLAWSCMLLALSTWLISPFYFTQALNPFLIMMFAVVGYTTYVYALALQSKRVGSGYALASTVVIMLVMVLINLEYFQLLLPTSMVLFAGYFMFLFLQSLVLAFRFAHILDEARKQALQGLQAKTEFMSTMSHEIRTPLNAVIGMTHLLLKSNPRADQQEQLNVMMFSSKNLLNIVNDILDYNKIEEGKIVLEQIPVDLDAICRNIIFGLKSQALEKGVEVRFVPEVSFRTKLLGDPTRLTQVISNLVQNAIKFTKKGWVEVRMKELARSADRLQFRLEVEDTGIGIPEDKIKRIFERFTQADSSTTRGYGGTGLGLSIARRILLLYGSDLQVKSVPEQGSVFWFELNLALTGQQVDSEDESIGWKEETVDDLTLLTGSNILLVEDNLLNIKVATAFLTRWGATVEVAMNGQEALDKLEVHRHHLILMDLHMPVMDGYEATKLLRERGVKLPIVALTASLAHEVESDAHNAGLDVVVVKPFNPEELKKAIWQQLNKSS
ncbi:MAG: ATP-binding protein [Bacteroidia bacterium]